MLIYIRDEKRQRSGTWKIHSRVALNLGRRVGCTADDSAGDYLFITDNVMSKIMQYSPHVDVSAQNLGPSVKYENGKITFCYF